MPQALAITGLHRIEPIAYVDPPLGPREVLVRTTLASAKRGTVRARLRDAASYSYYYDDDSGECLGSRGTASLPSRAQPYMLAASAVGCIEAVGRDVAKFHVGQEVCGLMGLRETNMVADDRLWPLDGMTREDALLLDPAYVALSAIRDANVRLGDRVLVIGLGAIGLLAVRLAKCAGARLVVAIGNSAVQRRWAERFGADVVLDGNAPDLVPQARASLASRGADVAIEAAGSYAALGTAVQLVSARGTVCALGFYQGEANSLWLGREWHHNQLTIIVPRACGRLRSDGDGARWNRGRMYDTVVSMLREHTLTGGEMIGPFISFTNAADLVGLLERPLRDGVRCAIEFGPAARDRAAGTTTADLASGPPVALPTPASQRC